MKNVMKTIEECGIVPVITLPDIQCALPLAQALMDGDISVVEFTLRNPFGLEAIAAVKKRFGERFTVGAGTVLSCEQADQAMEAGADFIVAPGFDRQVVEHCLKKGIAVLPGCTTAGEIGQAVALGLSAVKFFPAESVGGVSAMKLLASPFKVRFVPTGGITLQNIGSYLENKEVLACGGSFMISSGLLKKGDFEEITALCRQVREASLDFKLAHAGINCENGEEALAAARAVSALFGFPVEEGGSSVFAGQAVECMKSPYFGKNGHIGFSTASMTRALAYFRRRGVAIREESIKCDDGGELVAAYFAEEIAGFAIHIVRR